MLSFFNISFAYKAKSYIEIKNTLDIHLFSIVCHYKVFLYLGRGVPGRGVPVKKSIWAEGSRAEMVLGRGVPEPSERPLEKSEIEKSKNCSLNKAKRKNIIYVCFLLHLQKH